MKTDAATLKRFAELLKVDEVRTFDPGQRQAYGFMLRIGVLWQKVEIDEADLCRVAIDKRIEHVVRILFESARNLRWRIEQEQRSLALRNIVDEAARVKPLVEPTFDPLRMDKYKDYIDYFSSIALTSYAVPAELLGIGAKTTDDTPSEASKSAGRFEMICLELEDL